MTASLISARIGSRLPGIEEAVNGDARAVPRLRVQEEAVPRGAGADRHEPAAVALEDFTERRRGDHPALGLFEP